MKWFLIQSFFLALACFGLGALFHRLLWRKGQIAGSSSTGSVDIVSALEEAQNRRINRDAAAARAADLAAVRAEHDRVLADRESKIKELTALSFEHAAANVALADRAESVTVLRSQLDAAAPASSAAADEIQGLLGQVESHRATIEELRSQLAAASVDKDAALAAMRADYHGRLAALSSEHDAALAALRAEHDLALQEASVDRHRILSRLRSDHERSLAELRRRAKSAEHDLTRLTAVHEGCAGKLARIREELDTKRREALGSVANLEATKLRVVDAFEAVDVIAFEADDVPADDLLRIEGIGPKINEILTAGGVRTFQRLAGMTEERLRSIVNSGGVSFIPSVGSWAGPAALLRDGDEAGFQALVDRLVSGHDEGG